MSCKIKQELVHFIYGESSLEERCNIKEHLVSCDECRMEYDLLVNTKDYLNKWDDISPSFEFKKILQERLQGCEQEEPDIKENLKYAFYSMIKTLSPGICGILVTTFMVLLMSRNVEFSHLNSLSLVICGVFWSGIYSMVFDLAIKNGSYGDRIHMRELLGLNLKTSVYGAFLAVTLAIILMQFDNKHMMLIQEFACSFLPLFISSYLFARKVGHNHVLHGIFLAILYILMIGPALYMQSVNFYFITYVLIIAVSFVGAITGGIIGSWLSSRFILTENN